MAMTRRTMRVEPDDVMRVLTNGDDYPRWVIGPRTTVQVDPSWPAPGASFVHETGRGPFTVRDRTEVVAFDEEAREFVLDAHTGPLGTARIVVHVHDDRGRARVELREDARSGPMRLAPAAVRDRVVDWRNRRALRRLERLAMVRRPTR